METNISQYGNSLAVRIPKPFAKELGLIKGSTVKMYVRDNKIIVEVVHKHKKLVGTAPVKLLKFVGRLPKENCKEIDQIIQQGCEQIDDESW